MRYSLSENGPYSAVLPTGINAGTYTVWYRLDEAEPQSLTSVILKASQTAPEQGKGYTLNGAVLSVDTESTNEKAGHESHYELYDGTNVPIDSGFYTVDRNKTYYVRWGGSANYKPSPFTEVVLEVSVTAAASPASMGSVSVTGVDSGGMCDVGSSVMVTAVPVSGCEFVNWQYSDGTEASSSANYRFTATQSVILTAVFKPVGRILAPVPTVIDGLIYTGSTQMGIANPAQMRYTWTADSVRQAVNAGTYTATAVLEYGYVWSDETDGVKVLTWRIGKAPQDAPDGLSATDDSIIGTTADMEYRAADAQSYTNAADGSVTDLAPGTYYVRYREDANHHPSDIAVVTVSRPTIRAITMAPSQLESGSAALNGYVSPKNAITEGYVSGVGFEYRKTSDAAWTGADAVMGETFTRAVSGLTDDTDYVCRSVVSLTDGGTAYGEEAVFHTPPAIPTATGRIEVSILPENPEDRREVFVSVEEGNDVIASKDMGALGIGIEMSVSFEALPDGNYNIVVHTRDGDFTETRMITVTNGSTTQTVFTIPMGKIASIVEVKESGSALPTPKIAVEGLNEIITQEDRENAAAGMEDVEVRLEVENVGQNAEGAAELNRLYKIDTFLDIGLFKTTIRLDAQGNPANIRTSNIGSTNRVVLEIAIPCPGLAGRTAHMYAYHNGASKALTALSTRPRGDLRDGTFYADHAGGYLFLYASSFSTYAYTLEDTGTTPSPTPTPSGGGSRGGKTTSAINPNAKPDANASTEPSATNGPGSGYTTDNPAPPTVTGVSNWLITEQHHAYIGGFSDGTFRPSANITRAQAAMMFYRLLKNPNVNRTVSFNDMNGTEWYAEAVYTLAGMGVIQGYADGSFHGNDTISRAAFTAIASRLAAGTASGNGVRFSDVPAGHWASGTIAQASGWGWIGGYSDGTFRPADPITRAAVTAIINRMLGRSADQEYVTAHNGELKRFTDVQDPSAWYYYNVAEAANGHSFTKTDGKESWNG